MEHSVKRLKDYVYCRPRQTGKSRKIQQPTKEIQVIIEGGTYSVPADFESGFVLVPSPGGSMKLVFWDKGRLTTFLECYGFVPIIMNHSSN